MRKDEKNLMCAAWLSGYMVIACKYLKGINGERERNQHRHRNWSRSNGGHKGGQ